MRIRTDKARHRGREPAEGHQQGSVPARASSDGHEEVSRSLQEGGSGKAQDPTCNTCFLQTEHRATGRDSMDSTSKYNKRMEMDGYGDREMDNSMIKQIQQEVNCRMTIMVRGY